MARPARRPLHVARLRDDHAERRPLRVAVCRTVRRGGKGRPLHCELSIVRREGRPLRPLHHVRREASFAVISKEA